MLKEICQNEEIIWPSGTMREEVPYVKFNHHISHQNFSTQNFTIPYVATVDRGSTVVKVLCYKSEGRWFDPSWCHWIFH